MYFHSIRLISFCFHLCLRWNSGCFFLLDLFNCCSMRVNTFAHSTHFIKIEIVPIELRGRPYVCVHTNRAVVSVPNVDTHPSTSAYLLACANAHFWPTPPRSPSVFLWVRPVSRGLAILALFAIADANFPCTFVYSLAHLLSHSSIHVYDFMV